MQCTSFTYRFQAKNVHFFNKISRKLRITEVPVKIGMQHMTREAYPVKVIQAKNLHIF